MNEFSVATAEPIVDTTSEFAELVLALFGIAVMQERRRMKDSTERGRPGGNAKGVKFGREPKVTEHQRREAIKRRDAGTETMRAIAQSYNVSHHTISRLAL